MDTRRAPSRDVDSASTRPTKRGLAVDNNCVYGSTYLTYVADFPAFDPLIAGDTAGTNPVNIDVQLVRKGVEDCQFSSAARLSCDRGITDNASDAGNVIIVAKDSDYPFEFSGLLTRMDSGLP